MSKMSHINVIEKHEEHRGAIHHLLSSILGCFANERMFQQNETELAEQLNSLSYYYPFVSLLFLLDESGAQVCMNVPSSNFKNHSISGKGADRSRRPYFLAASKNDTPIVTEPYLSSVDRDLCLSACIKRYQDDGTILGYVVLDFDLSATLTFLTGDRRRVYFEPYFKTMYSMIVIGLFAVALVLLYAASLEFIQIAISVSQESKHLDIPFGMVIYLTLALAIFDLGKTTLEEEVLLYKDILRHSSTRRTITRFIAAIIIAISIEALLMIFKFALNGEEGKVIAAVWVILASAVLLLCLGVYIYLGSKAEIMLIKHHKLESNNKM